MIDCLVCFVHTHDGHTHYMYINTYRDGSGCVVLLANDKQEDLSRMYRLLKRVPEEGKTEGK